jgi:hypothetical protein
VLEDVLTIHGSRFKDAALIVASPPCQEYSYMAMPWSKAKAKAKTIRDDTTGAELERLNRLFNACFRIQAEASLAAGRHIPMVVENVRGAIPWVGRSRWNFGSFHLWGDVPALMPMTAPRQVMKAGIAHRSDGATNFHEHKVPGFRFDGSGRSFQTAGVAEHGVKVASQSGRRTDPGKGARFTSRDCGLESAGIKNGDDWFGSGPDQSLQRHYSGTKQPGIGGKRTNGKGDAWFQDGAARCGSKSTGRKMASAMIALSRHIAGVYHP